MRSKTAWYLGLALASGGCATEAPVVTPPHTPPETPPSTLTPATPVASDEAVPLAVHPPGPTPPAHADWLSDGFEKLLLRRARVAGYGQARLRSDVPYEEAGPRGSGWGEETLVVAEELPERSSEDPGSAPGSLPKQIRVVFETQDLRILLWLASDQLHRTPQRSVRLGFGARTPPVAPLAEEPAEALPRGVTLEPGARLRVSGTHEGRTYVKAGASLWGGAVDVEGWIPGDTPIGLTFVATAGAASRKDAGKTWTLEGTANVLSSPGGKPIARFRSSAPDRLLQTLTEVGPSRGWLREVVFRGEGLAVRGFIAKNKLDDAGGLALMGRGRGGEPMVVSGPSQLIEIPRGTCLYDGLRGAVIGVTRVAFQHTVGVPEEDQGWRQLPLADGFSYEPWVRLADVRPGELGKLKAAPALPLELGKWGCPE